MARVTSDTTPQRTASAATAPADRPPVDPAPLLPLAPLGDPGAAVCVDGVCRLPD
jgi:hypothetical protein